MGTVQRLQQFIENKGISKYRFYQESGLSNGSLDKGENIGSDKCEKILYAFPDLNSDWLLTGRGPMLKSDAVLINEPEMKEKIVLPAKKNLIPFYDDVSTIGGLNDRVANTDPVPQLNGLLPVTGFPKRQQLSDIMATAWWNTQVALSLP